MYSIKIAPSHQLHHPKLAGLFLPHFGSLQINLDTSIHLLWTYLRSKVLRVQPSEWLPALWVPVHVNGFLAVASKK